MLDKLISITNLKALVALVALSSLAGLLPASAAPASTLKNAATNSAKAKPIPAKADAAAAAAPTKPAANANAEAPHSQSWTGYLVDRSCAAAIKGDNKDAMKSVKEHTKACSLEPSCCEAGFSIYSQGQWLDLDNGSSQIAKKVMQATKRDKAHVVRVVGIMKRGEVRASTIVEVN